MTLEQIRSRQEKLNKQLQVLLEDMKIVVESIVGEQPNSPDSESMAKPYSGLLDEIELKQNITEHLIEQLSRYRELLSYSVYAPVETACSQVKSVY